MSRKKLCRNPKLELKFSILEKCGDEVEILSASNLFCRTFAVSVSKSQLFVPPTHNAGERNNERSQADIASILFRARYVSNQWCI